MCNHCLPVQPLFTCATIVYLTQQYAHFWYNLMCKLSFFAHKPVLDDVATFNYFICSLLGLLHLAYSERCKRLLLLLCRFQQCQVDRI